MGSIWLFPPNSSKQKEIICSRLKSYCSARNRFILTLPIGFSIRGLVKQTGVMPLYIEVFHCCSYKKGNRKISETWLAFLLHGAISSFLTIVPQALTLKSCHLKCLSQHLCTGTFSLQPVQTHLTLCRDILQNHLWHFEGIHMPMLT